MEGPTNAAREPSVMERLQTELVNLHCGLNDLQLGLRLQRGRLLSDLPPSADEPATGGKGGPTPSSACVSFLDISSELERINAELREARDHATALRKIG